MMPASNMKIVTLAAAAETLGWDYRFKTTLETTAEVDNGVLKGDLIVRGTGDPTINARDKRAAAVFDEWAAALKAAGISRIDGNVVGDATRVRSAAAGPRLVVGLPAGRLRRAVRRARIQRGHRDAVGPSRPETGDDARDRVTPGAGLGLIHHVVTGEPGSATKINVERRPDGAWLDVSGSIAVGRAAGHRATWRSAIRTMYFAHALLLALVERGIPSGPAARGRRTRSISWPAAAPRAGRIAIAAAPGHRDDDDEGQPEPVRRNAAEGGGRGEVGRHGHPPTPARAAARDIFAAWAIPPGTYVQVDGSGLSRYDFVTAEMIAALLERMYKDPRHHDAFVATLPIAGKDGTISTRMKNTRAEANAVAKTGSISNVRALSGYVRTRDGDTLVFSILANNFTIPAATVNWIADLAVERLANFTRR